MLAETYLSPRLTVAFLALFALLTLGPGCSKKEGGLADIIPNATTATMSPKPPMYGVLTGTNFFNAVGKSTGINVQNDAAAFASFGQIHNDLPVVGGMEFSGNTIKKLADFAGQVAVALVNSDGAKQLSDSTRVLKSYNLNVAFTSPEGADTFSTTAQSNFADNLAYSLTGLPPLPGEKAALVKAMADLRPKMPDTVAGKRLLAAFMITMVLVGHGW